MKVFDFSVKSLTLHSLLIINMPLNRLLGMFKILIFTKK